MLLLPKYTLQVFGKSYIFIVIRVVSYILKKTIYSKLYTVYFLYKLRLALGLRNKITNL